MDEFNNIALINASRNGHYEAAKISLENGANIHYRDELNNTALIWASISGHYEIVKIRRY